jgi:proton-translocating NADH-quinone oxidoreductase chain L
MSDWQGWLYVAAVLIPLAAFAVQALFGRWLRRLNALVATGAIAISCLLSLTGFLFFTPYLFAPHEAVEAVEDAAAGEDHEAEASHVAHSEPKSWRGSADWVWVGPMSVTSQSPDSAQSTETQPALKIPLAIHIDGLSVIMFVMVTFIATLIHIYSMGYMADDPRYPRFFTYLSLFCFSMLGLVASANIFMVFMCWELVGVCSYLLIGFWYEDKKNCAAANKAFIVNRVGDVGMLVGLGVLWTMFGTFSISDINKSLTDERLRDPLNHRLTFESSTKSQLASDVHLQVADPDATASTPHSVQRTIPYWLLVVAGLGIFAGCVGKSAQFPLHVWLPDAMAGPTPVSALIHAATMVAAGVYLVGRFFPLFTHDVLRVVAYTGAITLLIGATIAVVQTDYKKVLAYSTVSQLGFMIVALGVGGWAAGLFHLLTHAFFKALLFLCAGSVYHSVHTYEMPVLGGLFKKMPVTGWCMLVGTLAISGVPFFSGFYSKDAILASCLHYVWGKSGHPEDLLLFVIPAVGAVLTAFYMFRMWFLIFDGEPRGAGHAHTEVSQGHFEVPTPVHAHAAAPVHPDADASQVTPAGHSHDHNPVEHAHESPPLITWPLKILAAFSIFVGWPLWLGLPISTPVLEAMLETAEPLRPLVVGGMKWVAMGASLLIATTGIALAAGYYSRWRIFDSSNVQRALRPLHTFFVNKWYFDEIYSYLFVRPTLALSRGLRGFDGVVVDGLVNGTARFTRAVSRIGGAFDRYVIDGLVNASAWIVYGFGLLGRTIQTGHIRFYLGLLAAGVVLLFLGLFWWVL